MRSRSPKNQVAPKRPLRKLISALIAVSTAIAASLIPLPASAANLFTHIDENFNTTGFANFSSGPDYVRVVGSLENSTFNASNRRFSVSIEGTTDPATHKAVLRAYKPENSTGSYSSWAGSNTSSPVQGFVLDTTFGTGGVLEILNPAGTGSLTTVTSVLFQPGQTLSTTSAALSPSPIAGSNLAPSLLVVSAGRSYVIRLDTSSFVGGLPVCTSACTQHALDVTDAITLAAGAGAVPTGFVRLSTAGNDDNGAEAYVSGTKSDGTPFIAKIHLGVFIQGVSGATLTTNTNHALGSGSTTVSASNTSSSGAVISVAGTVSPPGSIEVGMKVEGTGLQAGTVVKSVDSATTFTVDPAPSSPLVSQNLSFFDSVNVFGTAVRGVTTSVSNLSATNVKAVRPSGNQLTISTGLTGSYGVGAMVIRSNGLGRGAGTLNNYVEIPASEFATGDYSGFTTFTPVANGLVVWGPVLHIAGNISNGTKSVGVVIRRALNGGEELRRHETQAVTHIDLGTASTQFDFWSGASTAAVLGGSFTDTGNQARPVMVRSTNSDTLFSTFVTHKLDVDSSTAEKLLAARVGGSSIKALASDGEGVRVYTWASTPTVDNTAPSASSRQTFGLTGAAPSSAVISNPTDTNSGSGNGMISFTGYSKAAGASIVAAQFQSRLPRYLTASVLALSGDWLRLSTTGSTQLLSFSWDSVSSYFSCDAAFAGSSLAESTPATPSGCTAISGLELNSSYEVRTTSDANKSLLVGNVIRKITHTNPDFVYWTNSVQFAGTGGAGAPPTTPSGTPSASNPAPASLTGGGAASRLVTQNLITTIQQTPGNGSARTIQGGVSTQVTAAVSRVTATTPVAIRDQAANMKSVFDSKGGDSGKITVVNTATGASIFGLIKNTVTNQPIGVPAQDVLMVSTSDQAILLAAASNNQPAKVNANGVLVVNNGGLLGAAANGFTANTQGELVLLSTPTLLGNFTTDATGSFAGQAVIPAGFPVGNHTAVLVTSNLVTSMGVTVEPATGSVAPNTGLTGEPAAAAGLATTGNNRSLTDSWLAAAGLLVAIGLVMVLGRARGKKERT